MLVIEIKDTQGNVLHRFTANSTEFSTGSKGYKANGKATFPNGKRYQCGMNLVEIGSKPKGE